MDSDVGGEDDQKAAALLLIQAESTGLGQSGKGSMQTFKARLNAAQGSLI